MIHSNLYVYNNIILMFCTEERVGAPGTSMQISTPCSTKGSRSLEVSEGSRRLCTSLLLKRGKTLPILSDISLLTSMFAVVPHMRFYSLFSKFFAQKLFDKLKRTQNYLEKMLEN